ncbi:hypothetical protein [Flavobacterium silvaticum]|uniref:Uncharacterized protein n=1 Tax=Flavobacterium silvaticum TaxID=1852020 RepID=A0A972FUP9_9FLAO|nr:hypothetical protein [Flavobacterium silvaticum]NMH29674.1 hypothetical protein [Flavobacterium silvaticum]
MKARILLIVFLMVSVAGYSNHIPKPSVLFSITEKILAQAQQFLFASTDKPAKATKAKPVIKVKAKAPLTVPVEAITPPDKPEVVTTTTITVKTVTIKRDGMFIVCEQ